MGHYEDVCSRCCAVLRNPAFDRTSEIAGSCAETDCPVRGSFVRARERKWHPRQKIVAKKSDEVLAHFQCGSCQQWWTVGDAPTRAHWFCPWCGTKNHE